MTNEVQTREELITIIRRLPRLPNEEQVIAEVVELLDSRALAMVKGMEAGPRLTWLCERGQSAEQDKPSIATPESVLDVLGGDDKPMSCKGVSKKLWATTKQTGRVLAKLVGDGQVETSGTGPGKRYWLSRQAQAETIAGAPLVDGAGAESEEG